MSSFYGVFANRWPTVEEPSTCLLNCWLCAGNLTYLVKGTPTPVVLTPVFRVAAALAFGRLGNFLASFARSYNVIADIRIHFTI